MLNGLDKMTNLDYDETNNNFSVKTQTLKKTAETGGLPSTVHAQSLQCVPLSDFSPVNSSNCF